MDFVFVKDLAVRTISGVDAWKRPQTQPLAISIFINSNFRQAGQTDHLRTSLNYDVISRTLSAKLEQSRYRNLTHVAESVASGVLEMCNPGDWARIHVKKPRHLLRADSAELVITRQTGGAPTATCDLVKINQLGLVTVIGVNNIERLHRQNVLIDLDLYKPVGADEELYDAARISETVAAHVENATYKTLEAFTESIAHIVISLGISKVRVSAAKPSALTWAKCAGIEVVRTRDDYSELLQHGEHSQQPETMFPQTPVDTSKAEHTVYLAFGTNVGDRLANIRTARTLLQEHGVEVVRTSSIYRSAPMFVQDQQEFYNGVFAATTRLSPQQLLKAIKEIEYDHLKREHGPRNGPRPMDIDILLYDDAVLNTPDLIIPHIDMLNRSFVLQPLVDVAAPDLLHPLTAEPFSNHLAQIPSSSEHQASSALTRILPCGSRSLEFGGRTHIMAIMNATPDSFSDGGALQQSDPVQVAQQHIANGATILDVGGLSTRPGSEPCTAQEEIDRVVPVIKQVSPLGLVSIDTYRGDVARAALDAGASIINDVFSGQQDAAIFDVAAEYQAPLILTHSRGAPETMNNLAEYSDVVAEVGQELVAFVNQAIDAGVGRWQLILDPGFGFAKTLQHNLELVRRFSELKATPGLEGIPWLVGTSRKRFTGTLSGRADPQDRDVASAATLGPLIAQGAQIVRVHNSRVAADTVAVVDAIYKN